MLQKLRTIALATLLSTSAVYADGGDFFDIKVGAGSWAVDAPVGAFGNSKTNTLNLTNDFGIADGTANYMWAEFQHGIPLIPHVRVEFAEMTFAGSSTSTITFGPYSFDANVTSNLVLDNVDVIAFWDFGFDDIVDFNFGAGAKVIVGELQGEVSGVSQTSPIAAAAVYAYLNPRVELPLGFGVDLAYKWYPGGLTLEGDLEFSELIAKVDYTLEWAIFKLGVEAGFRSMELTLDLPTDQVYIHTELEGTFVGAFLKIGI